MTNSLSTPKSKNNNNNTNLPPKPYTEYTIFFRLERTYILQSSGIIDEEAVASLDPNHHDPLEFPRPDKYQCLALPPYWYSRSHKEAIEKKRKHRKRKGRMDIKTLSKTISASWRNADRASIEYCRKLARAELKKYNELIEGTVERQGNQVPTVSAREQPLKRPEVPDGALFLQDSVLTQVKQVTPTMPVAMTMQVADPCSGNNDKLRQSFNEVMGFGQIDRQDKMLLQMLHLQAAQQYTKLCSNSSPTTVDSSSPFINNGGILPERKRKFVHRASAPPEFMGHGDIKPHFDMVDSGITCGIGSNINAFIGEENSKPPKQMRRRSSIVSMGSQEVQALAENTSSVASQELKALNQTRRASINMARQEFSESFEQEINNGSFVCVPEWEKEDADTLLDILNVSQVSEPVTNHDIFPLATNNQDMSNMFMETLAFEQPIGSFGM